VVRQTGVDRLSSGLLFSLILTGAALMQCSAPYALSQTPSATVQQVLGDLPACSELREDLERGTFGDGVEQLNRHRA